VRLLDGLGVTAELRAETGTEFDTGMSSDFTPRVKYEPRSTADVADHSTSLLADCDVNTLRRASLGVFVIQPSLYTPLNTYNLLYN